MNENTSEAMVRLGAAYMRGVPSDDPDVVAEVPVGHLPEGVDRYWVDLGTGDVYLAEEGS